MKRATYLTTSGIRLLNDWGVALRRTFTPAVPYLVGSALTTAGHRDVDVRVMLADHQIDRLAALVNLNDFNLAISLWGQHVTSLPIDFQIQRIDQANAEFHGRRHPLGLQCVADQPATESDEERDARFAPGNDATWGAGNWVRCDTCPPDDEGRAVYHHRDAHVVADQPATSDKDTPYG